MFDQIFAWIPQIFLLLGGLALFLFGMNLMSQGLEKLAGSRLESLLKKMTSNVFKGLLLGLGVTVAIQSSSAVTVMLVGLVNSGIMQLSQTVGVIMGSNIGTTITAWLLSLMGIEGSGWTVLLKPSTFSPLLAFIGILLQMMGKKDSKKNIGSVLLGFAILMSGMDFMSNAVEPLKEQSWFTSLMTVFTDHPLAPLFGILIGTVVTAVIQSSSASVGILQALSMTGSITIGMAFPIILGQNIGTTITSVISSVGVTKNAKRVAVVHASFNIIGSALFLVVFWVVSALAKALAATFPWAAAVHSLFAEASTPFTIAVSHTLFNVVTTILLLPTSRLLVLLANKIIRDKEEKKVAKEEVCFLDARLFATPSIAVAQCNVRANEMARLAKSAILASLKYLHEPSDALRNEILEYEDKLDGYEDALGKYLVTLSSHDLTERDSRQAAKILHSIGNFERIGDHAVNMLKVADEIDQKGLSFSPAAQKELETLNRAITTIVEMTETAFETNNIDVSSHVEPLEQVIDELIAEIRSRHIGRLQKGNCTVEMGFVLADLLNNYERVSDHCSNLAVAVIEAQAENDAGAHAYLQQVKGSYDFNEIFEKYLAEYPL